MVCVSVKGCCGVFVSVGWRGVVVVVVVVVRSICAVGNGS